jgi:NAD(P)-dependent dehydrogenase (short-subunit alcohol dehydrogenase family)
MEFSGTAVKLPMVAPLAKGCFKAAGINVKVIDQPAAIPGVQALISTHSNVGEFSVATVAQVDQAGEDVRFFCGTLGVVQSTLLTVKDSKLPSVEDGSTYKHGVLGLTKVAAVEHGPDRIRVDAILPGGIDTPMLRGTRAEYGAPVGVDNSALSLFGRLGTPEEIAEAALWLCSDRSSFVTGHGLAVDAGYLAR